MKARLAASVVLALAVALGTAGCNLIAPQATTQHYDPSDGVSGKVGSVAIRNAMLITEDGTDATLVAAFVSTDNKPHTVTVQYETDEGKQDLTVKVLPDGMVGLSQDEAAPKVLRGINVTPGSLFPVYFQYGNEPGVELELPVLTGDFEDYTDLIPTTAPTATAVPEPTMTASPEPTATPAP